MVTPAGGGPFALTELTIGVFRTSQPDHRLSVGTDKAKRLPLTAGEGWIMPAGAEGLCRYEAPLDALTVTVPKEMLLEAGLSSTKTFAPVVGRLDPLLVHLAETMQGLPEQNRLYAETMQLSLAAHVARLISPQTEANQQIEDKRLRRALAYLQDHLSSSVTVSELAREAGMSDHHFTRAFRAATGKTPLQYVISERIDAAKALLRATPLPVAEIAHRVGYEDVSRFGQHFKRATGATPATFRSG